MHTHLLTINDSEAGRVRFKLIKRDDLRAEDYVAEDTIASLSV